MKHKSGFTLIELLVVMAIIAMLITLGIAALVQFVSTVEIVETGNQSVELMDLLKNAAKNDVRPPRDSATGDISVYFKGFNYDFTSNNVKYCFDTSQFGQVVSGNVWDCQYDPSISAVVDVFALPIIISQNSITSPAVSRCENVYFESLTGDIYVQPEGDNIATDNDCFIAYEDTYGRYTWYIFVDGIIDDISIYKDFANVVNAASQY